MTHKNIENNKKMLKYLVMSKKSSTFAAAFAQWYIVNDQMVNGFGAIV